MKRLFLIHSAPIVGIFLLTHPSLRAETFFNDHANGWHWYQETPNEEGGIKEDIGPSSPTMPPKTKTPEELIDSYKKELSRRFAKAWLYPTPSNIMAYQDMQKDMVDRSKTFSTVWMTNVYTTPHLDHTLISPVNQQARHVHLDLEKKHTKEVIKRLSQSYGLFFFFSSGCEYCHRFAPIVAEFSKEYEWEVLAISTDGGALETFPRTVPDNGLIEQWHIQVLPSLYAVNPSSGHVIPIAHGMISRDQMEARIRALEGERG